MKIIRVGLLGFGQTGSVVGKEIIKDELMDLRWVCRRTIPRELSYASHAFGIDENRAPFVRADDLSIGFLQKNKVDVIVDFSSNSGIEHYNLFSRLGIRIVSAISNYSAAEKLRLSTFAERTSLLHSPNITLGINWLIIASKILKNIIPHADIEIVEEHFRNKKDVSGTAMRLAKHLDLNTKKHLNSIRVGGIVGKHEVIFGLPYQTLRLVHESVSRSAFGTGAIFAAKWLMTKTNGLYTMEEVFHEKFMDQVKEMRL
jgi:4-hydroxy-tetrahydrodipicolinate reductase